MSPDTKPTPLDLAFEQSSGNVFADLGLQNADELLAKADITHALNAEIKARGWTQTEAAERIGVTQADVSRLGRMKTDGFSQERLQNALRRLGFDVEIVLRRRESGIGTLRVRNDERGERPEPAEGR